MSDSPTCPVCGVDLPQTPAACPACSIELEGYWRVRFRSFVHYDRALELAAGGSLPEAACEAVVATRMEPKQLGFRMLSARLLGELGEIDAALEHGSVADQISGQSPEVEGLLRHLLGLKVGADEGSQGSAAAGGEG